MEAQVRYQKEPRLELTVESDTIAAYMSSDVGKKIPPKASGKNQSCQRVFGQKESDN